MKFFYTFTLLIVAQLCFSQKIPKELIDIEDDINFLTKQYKAVGLSIAIVKDNKTIYSQGFGYRDLEKNKPVTNNTVFNIGSTTKAFTGTLLGILKSQNQVSLSDKPSLHIPNFQFYNEKMDNLITIEDLLSHKSGIGNKVHLKFSFLKKTNLRWYKDLKPESEIKNSFEYSNIAYTLAEAIVEQITNKSWDNNIQEKIFQPLAMNSSYTTYEKSQKLNNYALPYGISKGKIEKVAFENFHSISPAGGIKSTVIDLSNWMLTWLNGGVFNNKQNISK